MGWKKYLSIYLMLLGSFFVSKGVFGANTDIVINEIGAYESSGHEWIEIWNKGSESVDLTGWKFWEANAASQNHKITTTTDSIVSAGEYAVIAQDAPQFILDYPNFVGSVFDSSFILNESGEEIGLVDSEGAVVEKFTYISASDFSLQRRDPFLLDYTGANWVEHTSGNTVGAVNYFASVSVSSTPTSTQTQAPAQTVSQNTPQSSSQSGGSFVVQYQSLAALKINELVVDPESENEWVELYNTSQTSVDIADAMICDARNTTSTCKKLVGAVGPNSWLFIDLQTRSFLNNSGDSVILKDVQGAVVDRIDYDDELTPDEGQSLGRKADGVDTDSEADWVVSDTVSPGKANIIGQEEEQKNTSSTPKTTKKAPSVFVWDISAPTAAEVNEQVTFSTEDTADPRGGIISFVWEVQGVKLFGQVVTTSFATSGTYNVIVFATSTSGYGEQKNIEITVGNGLSQNAEIIISEILPNPDGDDSKEFIEIKNNSLGSVNLAGWFLRVQDKKYIFPENTIIPSGSVLVFYKAVTKFSLVNTAGKVELLNKDKAVVDLVKYDKPPAGQSYTLINNQWIWVSQSPGTSLNSVQIGLVAGEKITNNSKSTTKFVGRLIIKIADARGAVKGQYAKLKGVVSVLPGVFGSQYFYLNSDNAGIQIYQNKKDFPPLAVGDSVEIQGAVSEANGIKRINIKNSESVDILSVSNRVTSTELNLDEIEESGAGALVSVEGQVTEIKSTFMYVDNGVAEIKVYFKQGAKIDKQKFKEGENVRVMGILEKVKDEWQIWPRSNDDLESLGMPDSLQGEEIAKPASSVGEKYLLVTVGGAVGLLLAFLGKARGLALVGWLKKAAGGLVKKP